MAQNLHINILAKDRTKQALGAVQAGLGRLKGAVFSIQSALLGVGGALVIRSLTKVGSEVENLKIRFAFLFKGMEEGNKAFDELIDFAAKVPFSLEEISTASGNLAVVSKDAEELAEVLAVTGNVAVVTGLDFRQTGEQIQRAFSGGIAAADVFRERGVRDLLGFEAGAKKTAKQTKEAFFKTFGPDGEFGKAMEVMATTFTGTLSMLSDKLFKFKLETDQAGFFDFVKNALAVINQMIENNEAILVDFAQKASLTLVNVIKSALLSGAILVDLFRPAFIYVAHALKSTFEVIKSLPPGVRELGIIGFFMLGTTGKLITITIGAVFDTIRGWIGDLMSAYGSFISGMAKSMRFLKMISEETLKANLATVKEFKDAAEKLNTPLKDINDGLNESEKYTAEWMILTKKLNEFFEDVNANIVISQEQLKKLLERIKGADKSTKSWSISMGSVAEIIQEHLTKGLENINQTIAKEILGGIKSWSKGMAEVLVMGKDLGETMRAIAQRFIINIVAKAIELVALWALELAMKKAGLLVEDDTLTAATELLKINTQDLAVSGAKLLIEKEITKQKREQAGLSAVSAAFAFFGFQHGGAVSKGKPILVGERGPELFVPNTTGQITQNARGTATGTTNINFSINATDVTGVRKLLIDNRATIVNVINSALNEKGREALV